MKLRTLASLVCLLPLAVASCSGDDTEGAPLDSGPDGTTNPEAGAPDTGRDQQNPQPDVNTDTGLTPDTGTPEGSVTEGGVTEGGDAVADGGGVDASPDVAEVGPPVEAAQLDVAELADAASEVDSRLLAVLPSVKGIVNMFVDEDPTNPTLNLSDGAFENANNINGTIGSFLLEKSNCTNLPNMEGSTATVTADFSGCTANDLWVDGQVKVVVTKPSSILTVTFTFTDLTVNGYKLNGTVSVKPAASSYPMTVDLAVTDVGSLTFSGTGTVAAPDAGGVVSTMSGTGTLTSPAATDGGDAGTLVVKTTKNGWTCTQDGLPSYQATGLSRALNACYPQAGTVTVTRNFNCHKSGVLDPDQTVQSTTVLEWLSTTPANRKVNVSSNAAVEDAGAGDAGPTAAATLPWTCPAIPSTPDGGQEVQPEAGPDAADDAAGE